MVGQVTPMLCLGVDGLLKLQLVLNVQIRCLQKGSRNPANIRARNTIDRLQHPERLDCRRYAELLAVASEEFHCLLCLGGVALIIGQPADDNIGVNPDHSHPPAR
jgi:hypothetical protein